ncbi:hypothetical protein [Arthrobacter sp. AD-310]
MRTFFYRNALLILLAGVFIIAGVSYFVVTGSQQEQVAAQDKQITELDQQMQARLKSARDEQQAVVDAALGTSAQRINSDTAVIRDFVKTVATWRTGEEYAAARESVIRKYKLKEDSQFLKTYFQEPVFNTDSSGNRIYYVDTQGLNSSLTSMEVVPLGVSGTEYRYMVLADLGSSSNDGKASADKTSVIYLTIDGEGAMTNVSGFASVSGERMSR